MKKVHLKVLALMLMTLFMSCKKIVQEKEEGSLDPMIIRIAELTIEPEHLESYRAILKEESEASIRLEPGVLCIYPMYEKDNPTRIKLLEIYRNPCLEFSPRSRLNEFVSKSLFLS